MAIYAAVLAAGSGQRFGADKVSILLRGKPMWQWSVDALNAHPEIAGVGLVASPSILEAAAQRQVALAFAVRGGASRPESCLAALRALPEDAEIVLIHDGARPLIVDDVVTRVIRAAQRSGAAAPAIAVADTIRQESEDGWAVVDRSTLRAMQTPQAVRVDLLKKAFEREGAFEATDEMKLVEAMGVKPELVEGSPKSMKITQPDDLAKVAALLGPAEVRTGIGYDVHRFSTDPNRPLWLGGVRFEGHVGLEGHSDADALSHAIVDAILGAAGLGDIGVHFPPSDPRWKDAPSTTFLAYAANRLTEAGWTLRNVDATIIAEAPKVMPRAEEVRRTVAEALGIEFSRVSLKATTNERLGAIGRGEGIAAFAVASIAQTS